LRRKFEKLEVRKEKVGGFEFGERGCSTGKSSVVSSTPCRREELESLARRYKTIIFQE